MRVIKLQDIYNCFKNNDCKIKKLKMIKPSTELTNNFYFSTFKNNSFTLKATLNAFRVLGQDGLKGIRYLQRQRPVIQWTKFINEYERLGMIMTSYKGFDWTYETRKYVDYLTEWFDLIYTENGKKK